MLLLNPKAEPVTTGLEIGVAYKFAEEMLDKYLPYASRRRLDSPAGTGNTYDLVLQAASKLPDEVLQQLREEFGSFGTISDPVRFAAITSGILSEDKVRLLCSDFIP